MKRMACVLALATGTGLALGATSRPVLAEAPAVVADGFQIAITATGAVTDESSVPLEVHFQGGNVGSIELSIDGAQVKKRSLNTRKTQGNIRFEIDPGLLGAGDHDVLIQAVDREGHVATATVHLHVASLEMSGIARLISPKKNATVQGIVPIEVKVDDSVHRPFVSFFVDRDFSMLNFAPFTYNWDSTLAANGPHTINVEVMDGDTQEIVRRFSLLVNVNNPGGWTNRQSGIRDLGQPATAARTIGRSLVDTAHSAAQFAAPTAHFDFGSLDHSLSNHVGAGTVLPGALHSEFPLIGVNAVARVTGETPRALPDGLLNVREATNRLDLRPLPGAVHDVLPKVDLLSGAPSIARPDHALPPTRLSPDVISRPGTLGLFANPHELLRLDGAGIENGPTLRTRLRSRRMGNVASMPQYGLGGTFLAAGQSTPLPGMSTNRPFRAVQAALSAPVLVNTKGTFQVAFDNTQIAFDVPPRVEHGLPLAPFRQIFEHTGGTVKWYGQSRTVRAYNATREIEFKVGKNSATVNNRSVHMDAQTYIDRGRTIVPLSFVRDAMNVSVQYDPATGHMRIESRH